METHTKPAGTLVSDAILDWRLEQLMAAGYDAEEALQVAVRNEIDLHRAVRLVRSGCPAETALRILL
jgi:hypothetical protein